MFGQLSCSISNDHLDLTVLAEKGSQSLLSGEAVFSGQKMFVHISPCSEHSPLPWGLSHNQVRAALRQVSRRLETGGATTLGLLGQGQLCPPRMWLCPVVLWDGHRRPYFNEAATQPGRHPASLNHGLWSIRDAKRNVLPGLALQAKRNP